MRVTITKEKKKEEEVSRNGTLVLPRKVWPQWKQSLSEGGGREKEKHHTFTEKKKRRVTTEILSSV